MYYDVRADHSGRSRFVHANSKGENSLAGYQDEMNLYQYVWSSPPNLIDPNGQIAVWIAECGLGACVGGIGGFVGGLFSTWSWRGTGCGALSGAIQGCCTTLVCTNMPQFCVHGSCICGAIGGFVNQICMEGFDYKDPCSWASLLLGGGAGCLSGLVREGELQEQLIVFLTGLNVAAYTNLCGKARDFAKVR